VTPEKAAKRHPVCPVEGHGPLTRMESVDAYACLECDQWREGKCDDDACQFCVGRPERPSAAVAPPCTCRACGHVHQGVEMAFICIGCPCPETGPFLAVVR
jgi:hypothetical protein